MEKILKGLLTMTKQSFLNALREALEDENVQDKVIEETIQEYGSMIDDALEGGETVESFIKRMGSPKKVAKALAGEDRTRTSNRLTALSPFIATILFFLVGVFYQAWHPGWLFYLLIPVTGILTKKPIQWKGLMVFVILTVFILGANSTNLWNPLWSLFLLLIPQWKSRKNQLINRIGFIYTYLAVALYHLAIFYYSFSFLGGSSELRNFYLTLPLILFIPTIFYALWNGSVQVKLDGVNVDLENPMTIRRFFIHLGFIAIVTLVYLAMGVTWGIWHPGWLIFFIIPIAYILRGSKRLSLTALMPFVATTLFVLVGEYASIPGQDTAYTLSWLFFFLIPISGILKKR
jgi:uncharacterized membrane protein